MRAGDVRTGDRIGLGTLAVIALLVQSSCVILPVRVAPGLSGQIVDQISGAPRVGETRGVSDTSPSDLGL